MDSALSGEREQLLNVKEEIILLSGDTPEHERSPCQTLGLLSPETLVPVERQVESTICSGSLTPDLRQILGTQPPLEGLCPHKGPLLP